MADAFTVYGIDSPKQARTLKSLLLKRRDFLASAIVDGAVADWADYQRRVGAIDGIDEALRVCDDLEKEAEDRR